MSFLNDSSIIEKGDTAILYFGFDNMQQILLKPNQVNQTKYGALKHDDLIGKRSYGDKVSCSKGWVFVLKATPELWTLTLPHRTQILYACDISTITMQLDLRPGSIVIESGKSMSDNSTM